MMTAYVLGEWFLCEVNSLIERIKALINLSELRRLIGHCVVSLVHLFAAIASISFLRLLFLLLKRLVSIVKSALRYFFIELPIPALEFLYVLHFARAFLRLMSYFSELKNKNSAEMTKFLLSCFKIFISFLILSLLIITSLYGIAPMSLAIYGSMKTSFRIYSGSKFIISLGTLLVSCYRREFISKKHGDDLDDAWLRAQYKDNYWKHIPILFIGLATTILLSLLSFMGLAGLGPVGFILVIGLACSFLLIDIIKSIYDAYHSAKVPEPKIGSLAQKNSFIDYSCKDYYDRKCRVGRLKKQGEEYLLANKVYLLKEIIVKMIQLKIKLACYTSHQAGFFSACFSERQKIEQKITGLMQEGSLLLSPDFDKNQLLFTLLIKALKEDYDASKNLNDKILAPIPVIENYINKLEQEVEILILNRVIEEDVSKIKIEANDSRDFLSGLLYRRDAVVKKNTPHKQRFYQSIFRKIGDCEDIAIACQALKVLEQDDKTTCQDETKISNAYLTSYKADPCSTICCIK